MAAEAHSRPRRGPIAKTAVAYASAQVSDAPTTVTLATPAAGWPRTGSMMCAPRSAVPDVATAKSRPDTENASVPGRSGELTPTRHGGVPAAGGRPGSCAAAGRPPTLRTSPPPLTRWLAEPASARMRAARSTDQPLTYPDGSSDPSGYAEK